MRQPDLSEQCLRQAYINANTGLLTAFENQKFTKPDTATPWAAVWYIPNTPSAVTAGAFGQDEATGIFQIDLNYPLYSGTQAQRLMVDKISNSFPSGYDLVYNGFWVRPRAVGRTEGREVDGWWRVSITVTWYSRLNRLGA